MDIRTNGLTLYTDELEAAQRLGERLNGDVVSLYRTSEGLKALVVDNDTGARYTGCMVAPATGYCYVCTTRSMVQPGLDRREARCTNCGETWEAELHGVQVVEL